VQKKVRACKEELESVRVQHASALSSHADTVCVKDAEFARLQLNMDNIQGEVCVGRGERGSELLVCVPVCFPCLCLCVCPCLVTCMCLNSRASN